MITFAKVNEQYANIKYNGTKIGILRNYLFSKEYGLEIGYAELRFGYDQKRLIPKTALLIHKKQEAQTRRRLEKEAKLRNSIYNR